MQFNTVQCYSTKYPHLPLPRIPSAHWMDQKIENCDISLLLLQIISLFSPNQRECYIVREIRLFKDALRLKERKQIARALPLPDVCREKLSWRLFTEGPLMEWPGMECICFSLRDSRKWSSSTQIIKRTQRQLRSNSTETQPANALGTIY